MGVFREGWRARWQRRIKGYTLDERVSGWLELDRHMEAMVYCDLALAKDGGNRDAHLLKAKILRRIGMAEASLACCDRVLDADPGDITALCAKADAFLLLGRGGEALGCYDLALEGVSGGPAYIRILTGKALVLAGLSRHEDASACCDLILDVSPGNVAALSIKARSLLDRDMNKDALECLKEAARTEPNDTYVLDSTAYLMLRTGRFREALPYYDRMLEMDVSGRILVAKSVALLGLGRNGEAVEYCNWALDVDPGIRVALVVKAGALGDAGRHGQALEYCLRAPEIDPGHRRPDGYRYVAA
ncbi:MAG: tetratricopeptide repeat protein [Alphaproteobacteria bacterium]|nr:tetratricopeptide repeat protein [Alphaproteobacteria bacterium]